ncbi:hypothetical protein FZW96_00740 [Bacillus sp. BGMRC 2118]|nr:hypothetical protein FZW96_00740 [Bacillus sp. BGMRC 2118]
MEEIITFFIIVILSFLSVASLTHIKRWFTKIEILLLFLFTSYFCQNMFYTITSPYDRLRVVEEHLPFWSVRLQYGVVFAITLLWVIAIYRSKSPLMIKLIATFSWIVFGILVEKSFLILGVLSTHSKSWYPSLDMFFEMLVILLTFWFSNFLRTILRKESII